MSVFDGKIERRKFEAWPADRVPKNNLERLIASVPMPKETALPEQSEASRCRAQGGNTSQ